MVEKSLMIWDCFIWSGSASLYMESDLYGPDCSLLVLMLLKSFPVVTPKLDDIRDEEEEHDADDSADVWEVTSVLERDFEDPNA